jgi:hypothetical protein
MEKNMHFEPYASIDGKEININSIPDRSITLSQWDKVRGNTPGFRALYSKLDDEALLSCVDNHLKNCTNHNYSTYDYSLQNDLIPEMKKRIEDVSYKNSLNKYCRYFTLVFISVSVITFMVDIFLSKLPLIWQIVIELGLPVIIVLLVCNRKRWLKKRRL